MQLHHDRWRAGDFRDHETGRVARILVAEDMTPIPPPSAPASAPDLSRTGEQVGQSG
ncbi:MAG: hypothetical protein U1E93_12745 [Alphaproteobacteria bacterium]